MPTDPGAASLRPPIASKNSSRAHRRFRSAQGGGGGGEGGLSLVIAHLATSLALGTYLTTTEIDEPFFSGEGGPKNKPDTGGKGIVSRHRETIIRESAGLSSCASVFSRAS